MERSWKWISVDKAGYRYGQGLYGEETKPDFLVDGKINSPDGGYYDGALEEILHPITQHGYANAYPEVFGEERGSILAKCMDAARGGYFEQVPTRWSPRAGIRQKLGITIRMKPVTMAAWLRSIPTGL